MTRIETTIFRHGRLLGNTARKCIFILISVVLMFFQQSYAVAETHESRVKMCEKAMGPIPAFTCNQGTVVPKKVKNGKCDKPEDLYARCVFKSTLGKLKSTKKDVEIVFSCRKEPVSGKTYEKDKSNTFYDIAIIQHNKKTGDTCFFQRLGDVDGDAKMQPSKDKNGPADSSGEINGVFWNEKPNFCTMCHSNGPFIRSPHYAEVKDSAGNRIIPSMSEIKDDKYKILHEHYEVYNISKVDLPSTKNVSEDDNACLDCHNIGAFTWVKNGQLYMGEVNNLAASISRSLREDLTTTPPTLHPSPTTSGYHDYMVVDNYPVGTQKAGKAAIKDLEKCFAKPTPKECKVTKLSTSP